MKNQNFRPLGSAMRVGTALCVLLAMAATSARAADNELTDTEREEGWVMLFDGESLSDWKNNNDSPVQARIKDGAVNPHGSGGYILVYDKPFGDFIFKCDVKMEDDDCNSGVFLRCSDLADPINTSLEVQVLGGDGTSMHDFGAIYDLVAPLKSASRGAGEWNTIEVRCEGPHVTVKVNGEEVAELDADEWTVEGNRPDGSSHKFGKAIKDFKREGYIGLQDHDHDVWYKNIKVREL